METQIPLLNWTQILQQFGYSVEYLSSINFSETNPQRAQLFIVGEGERYPTTVSRCAHPQLEDELRPNCTLNRNTAQHHGRAAEFLNAS